MNELSELISSFSTNRMTEFLPSLKEKTSKFCRFFIDLSQLEEIKMRPTSPLSKSKYFSHDKRNKLIELILFYYFVVLVAFVIPNKVQVSQKFEMFF